VAAASEVLAALELDGCEIVETLPRNWHGDGHWRVRDGAAHEYSVRAIGNGRSMRVEEARPYGTRTVLAQLRVSAAMPRAGVPMMPLEVGPVVLDDCIALAFGWLEGELAEVADAARATAVGRLVAQLHRAALPGDDALPVHDEPAAATEALRRLRGAVDESFCQRAAAIVERRTATKPARLVSHGDCNFPNVLWNGDAVVGLVDLDQIGLTDPLEELAYAVKWWSRPLGIEVHEHDRALAAAVLSGYEKGDLDRARLADLLWITGCLNANSVNHILAAPPQDRGAVVAALEHRADTLATLVV
jgi:aminoglycoside phosphotransferase (APT) family kinase protein